MQDQGTDSNNVVHLPWVAEQYRQSRNDLSHRLTATKTTLRRTRQERSLFLVTALILLALLVMEVMSR